MQVFFKTQIYTDLRIFQVAAVLIQELAARRCLDCAKSMVFGVKSIQIFKINKNVFSLMNAIANMGQLKFELKRELRQEILTEVLDIIRDEFYPAEEKIRPDFIKAVEEAERRVAEGNVSTYVPEEFTKMFF